MREQHNVAGTSKKSGQAHTAPIPNAKLLSRNKTESRIQLKRRYSYKLEDVQASLKVERDALCPVVRLSELGLGGTVVQMYTHKV